MRAALWWGLLVSGALAARPEPLGRLWPEPKEAPGGQIFRRDRDGIVGADTVAEPDEDATLPVLTVWDTDAADNLCEVRLKQAQIRAVPVRATDELFSQVPGVFQTTRLGFGGAYRSAWRGFATGYGSDVASSLEGVPLNEPGHAYSPGYTDLWAIPLPLVRDLTLCPGAARPDVGAYGVAGSQSLSLGRPSPGWWIQIGGGTDSSGKLAVRWSPERGPVRAFLHADVDGAQGVGEHRSWRQLRLAGKLSAKVDTVDLSAFLLAYDATNALPSGLRASDLAHGRVRFYGGYRDWESDIRSRRLLLGSKLSQLWRNGAMRVTAWTGLRGWRLRDDPSGFLYDSEQGDASSVRAAGQDLGLKAEFSRHWFVMNDRSVLDGGVELRGVLSRERQERLDLEGHVLAMRADQHLGSTTLAAWARGSIGFFDKVRLIGGLRIEDTEIARHDTLLGRASAQRSGAFVVLPSLAVTGRPVDGFRFALSWGRSFRPPDPHLLVSEAHPKATLFDTFDLHADVRPVPWLTLQAAGFASLSRAESLTDDVWERPLFTAPTRRGGASLDVAVDLGGLLASMPKPPVRNLPITLDVSLAGVDARRADTGELLPYTPRWSGSFGLQLQRWRLISDPSLVPDSFDSKSLYLTAGLQVIWAGRRPLPEGFMARGMANSRLTASVDWKRATFTAFFDNLIPVHWRQQEDFYASRWSQKDAGSTLPVRHVVAGTPFVMEISAGWRF